MSDAIVTPLERVTADQRLKEVTRYVQYVLDNAPFPIKYAANFTIAPLDDGVYRVKAGEVVLMSCEDEKAAVYFHSLLEMMTAISKAAIGGEPDGVE